MPSGHTLMFILYIWLDLVTSFFPHLVVIFSSHILLLFISLTFLFHLASIGCVVCDLNFTMLVMSYYFMCFFVPFSCTYLAH